MRAAIITSLFALGCAQGGPVPAVVTSGCEGDDMRCSVPHERFTQVNWLETTANTGYLYSNDNGCVYIALGSQDTVGAYVIRPARQQESSLLPIVVAAGAPYVGKLEGPLLITPFVTHTFTPLNPSVADILFFEDFPPFPVEKRAPLIISARGAGTGVVGVSINVRGRARVTASIRLENVVGAGNNFALSGYQIAAATLGGVGTNIAVQAGSYAGVTTNKTHEFFPTIGVPAGAYPGNDVLDFVEVYNTTTTEAGVYSVIVQAWD